MLLKVIEIENQGDRRCIQSCINNHLGSHCDFSMMFCFIHHLFCFNGNNVLLFKPSSSFSLGDVFIIVFLFPTRSNSTKPLWYHLSFFFYRSLLLLAFLLYFLCFCFMLSWYYSTHTVSLNWPTQKGCTLIAENESQKTISLWFTFIAKHVPDPCWLLQYILLTLFIALIVFLFCQFR